MRRNFVAGALGCTYGLIVFNFFQAGFARELGLTDVQFGYMSAIPMLVFPARLAGSFIVEQLGRRKKFFTVTVIISRLVWAVILYLPFLLVDVSPLRSWLFLLLLVVCYAVGVMAEPAWWSWMGDLIPESQRARFWSRRAIYVTVASIVPIVSVALAKDSISVGFMGFAVVLGFAVLCGVIDIVVHYGIPEPPMERPRQRLALRMLLEPTRDRRFRSFLLYNASWMFALSVMGQFGNRYMLETLECQGLPMRVFGLTLTGGQYTIVALIFALNIMVGVLGYSIWGMMVSRYGSKPVLQLCTLFAAFGSLPWLLVREGQSFAWNLAPIVFMFLVGGLTFTGVDVSATNLFYGMSPRQNRSMYVGINLTVVGLCGAVGPILSGYFMKLMDGRLVFGFEGYHLLCVISMMLRLSARGFLSRVEEPAAATQSQLVRLLTQANPLRVFPVMYSLAAPATEEEKILAVSRLGDTGTGLAASDLISHLEDPSPRVREEAVAGLVKTRDPEAIAALVKALDRRELGLDVCLARALGEAPPGPELQPLLDALGRVGLDPGAARALGELADGGRVEPLLESLRHPDPRFRATAAHFLAQLGDRRASEPLFNLLQGEQDKAAFGSYATALSALGEISAIWHILPVMRSTDSIAYRRQLAVAIGDLLGSPRAFYGHLDEESKVFGQSAGKMLARCRKLAARKNGLPPARREQLLRLLDAAEADYLRSSWTGCAARIAAISGVLTEVYFHSMTAAGLFPTDVDASALDLFEKIFLVIAQDERLGMQLWYMAVLSPEKDPEFHKLTFEGCLLALYALHIVVDRILGRTGEGEKTGESGS